MTHTVYAVFPKLLMQINPVRHRPKMTAILSATSGFLGRNYLHKLALHSGGTFDVFLIPYCRGSYHILHLDLLDVFVWEHQTYWGLVQPGHQLWTTYLELEWSGTCAAHQGCWLFQWLPSTCNSAGSSTILPTPLSQHRRATTIKFDATKIENMRLHWHRVMKVRGRDHHTFWEGRSSCLFSLAVAAFPLVSRFPNALYTGNSPNLGTGFITRWGDTCQPGPSGL